MRQQNVTCNPETGHVYEDLDGIRLVYENGEKVGWYRPDGWIEGEKAEDILQDGYERDIRADGSVLLRPKM